MTFFDFTFIIAHSFDFATILDRFHQLFYTMMWITFFLVKKHTLIPSQLRNIFNYTVDGKPYS
ncbi:protein of unknown function [Paenibacillus alvei]|uniref:Uncharacterized protein n=1 Tax=Paenibacillus alvei TaxID=44250 RepID=A0A383RHE2_PAEAL|nr:protein of unknown function [Paenibacillus alvei]